MNIAQLFPLGTRVRTANGFRMTVVDNEPADRIGLVWCAWKSGVDGKVIEAPYSWKELTVVSIPARPIRRTR